ASRPRWRCTRNSPGAQSAADEARASPRVRGPALASTAPVTPPGCPRPDSRTPRPPPERNTMPVLVATQSEVLALDEERSTLFPMSGLEDRPTCLAADPRRPGSAWCGTHRAGVF